ncbi:MAG: discoidin domain-containing protein [Ignavibacteriaceae bacterium]
MKMLSLTAGMLILVFVSTISPTSLNGRFVVVNSDSSKLAVVLQVNTNTGTDDLGGATIVIGFDKAVLNFSTNPVNQTDFVFRNFNGGNYNTATVTKPLSDKLWINIDLPYTNNGKGTVVSGNSNWTDVVTLYFTVLDNSSTIKLNWYNSSTFWGIYDADNKTLWTDGTLTNLEIVPQIIDVTAPDITGITGTNNRSVTLNFSEKLDPGTARDKNNYNISNNISISQVQLLPDSSSVLIKTSQLQSNIDYSVSVTNIKDMHGNLISPNPKTVSYKIASKGKGGKTKNTISYAMASSWDANFSADKTIDGIGSGEQDSRWKSSKALPDTLTYDLGDNVPLDSLRISFYKGESGRLYKYSVYSSKDSKDWRPVVNNVWSDEAEWTEVEFDSTKGRYVKLILKDCNQGMQASIWEFESYGTSGESSIEESIEIPAKFELSQNYPNPFNPSTKIQYTIPTSPLNPSPSQGEGQGERFVTLKVYDILGNEVATLVNEDKTAGSYEVEFKADNLASGVYIYRIQSAAYTDTKKMILLR